MPLNFDIKKRRGKEIPKNLVTSASARLMWIPLNLYASECTIKLQSPYGLD